MAKFLTHLLQGYETPSKSLAILPIRTRKEKTSEYTAVRP